MICRYVPFVNPGTIDNYAAYQNTAVFCVSTFQYITMAVIYSKSRPYRLPLFTNRYFSLSLLILTVICIFITVIPPEFMSSRFSLMDIPSFKFRIFLVLLGFLNFLVAYLIETYLIEWLLFEVIM